MLEGNIESPQLQGPWSWVGEACRGAGVCRRAIKGNRESVGGMCAKQMAGWQAGCDENALKRCRHDNEAAEGKEK